MTKFPGSMKVQVTDESGVWYCTGLLHKATPELTCDYLNKRAARQGLKATYAPATQAQYDAYKAEQRRIIAGT